MEDENHVDDRFCLHDEGALFINSDGELFCIIIAVECNDQVNSIREANEGVEVIINERRYTSHPSDEVVLLNNRRQPIYLFYRANRKLKRILSIATNRITLHWQFDQLQNLGEGSYHLRKSTLIPGHSVQGTPRC